MIKKVELGNIRKKLLKIEEKIAKEEQPTPLIYEDKYNYLIDYYEQSVEFILNRLEEWFRVNIIKVIDQYNFSLKGNTALIENSHYNEQRVLIDYYNANQAHGHFNGTIFEHGLFAPGFRAVYMENPPEILFKNKKIITPNQDVMGISYQLNKREHADLEKLISNRYEDFMNYLNQENNIDPETRELVKEYFLRTAPYVLRLAIDQFLEKYEVAKEEHSSIRVTVPMVNIKNKRQVNVLLETLYNELFASTMFFDTLLNKCVTSVNSTTAKTLVPYLDSPLEEFPNHQYNLCLEWNIYNLRK